MQRCGASQQHAPSPVEPGASTAFWRAGLSWEPGSRGATRPRRSVRRRGRALCSVCCSSSADSAVVGWCLRRLHIILVPMLLHVIHLQCEGTGHSHLRSMMLFGNIATVKSQTTSKPMSLRYLRKMRGANPSCPPVVPQAA